MEVNLTPKEDIFNGKTLIFINKKLLIYLIQNNDIMAVIIKMRFQMMKIAANCFGFSATRSTASLAGFHRSFYGNLQATDKVDLTWKNMKWSEGLADKARSLIYGERKYINFTPQEKRIVDYYQQKKLEEDAVILPNTHAAIEQDEIEQMLRKRY